MAIRRARAKVKAELGVNDYRTPCGFVYEVLRLRGLPLSSKRIYWYAQWLNSGLTRQEIMNACSEMLHAGLLELADADGAATYRIVK